MQLSGERIITMEWMDGCKLTDLEGLRDLHLHSRDVAIELLQAFAQMTFVDGLGMPHRFLSWQPWHALLLYVMQSLPHVPVSYYISAVRRAPSVRLVATHMLLDGACPKPPPAMVAYVLICAPACSSWRSALWEYFGQATFGAPE